MKRGVRCDNEYLFWSYRNFIISVGRGKTEIYYLVLSFNSGMRGKYQIFLNRTLLWVITP